MQYLFTFVVSLIITMLLVPPLIRLAPVFGVIDIPNDRKVHKAAIPRIGGIAMIIGAIVPIIFWLPFNNDTVSLLLGFLILLVFGVWDDKDNLHYKFKFLGQLLAVLVVVFMGDVVVYHVPFIDHDLPPAIAIPFTIFALVGITNAINLSDGLDGLAGGTMLLTFSMIAFLAYSSSSTTLVLICLSVVGAILGFLRHNTYPARIFMGDTGSQFLGFSAGVLVIVLSQRANTAISPVVPLVLLGLPILDTFTVMVQRIYEKKSPFSPDKNHIHHKLLDIGFDHYEAVFIIYLVQTALVTMAYFMRYESDLLIFLIYGVFSLVTLSTFQYARNTGWKVGNSTKKSLPFLRLVEWAKHSGTMERWSVYFLKTGLSVFFILSVLLASPLHRDISILALLLLALMIVEPFTQIHYLKKIVVYVTCVLSVYFIETHQFRESEYANALNVFVILIACAFALKVRFAKDKAFVITPLDFLVVLLVLAVPNMPEITINNIQMGGAAFNLIVLFYASEAVSNVNKSSWGLFDLGIIATLVIAAVKGFL